MTLGTKRGGQRRVQKKRKNNRTWGSQVHIKVGGGNALGNAEIRPDGSNQTKKTGVLFSSTGGLI